MLAVEEEGVGEGEALEAEAVTGAVQGATASGTGLLMEAAVATIVTVNVARQWPASSAF